MIFKPMTTDVARQMIGWCYDDAYSVYNITPDDLSEEIAFLCDPSNGYYAIYEEEDFIGHAVFGADARVRGGDYDADALDVGVGMRPDRTGKGNGTQVITAILDFARETFQPNAFRATILAWNDRSQKAITNNGFREVSRFQASDERAFIIFMRDA